MPSFVAPRNTQQRAKRVVVHSGDDEVPPAKDPVGFLDSRLCPVLVTPVRNQLSDWMFFRVLFF